MTSIPERIKPCQVPRRSEPTVKPIRRAHAANLTYTTPSALSTMTHDGDESDDTWDAIIIGGGLAGLTCSIFTARAELSTLVLNHGASLLKRNAIIENFPGFPAGVNPRLLIDMIEDQAERNGATLEKGRVQTVTKTQEGFQLETDEETYHAKRVVAASKDSPEYLEPLDAPLTQAGSKTYLDADEDGRTPIEGLYAAGRMAERYHQAIVSAGHGASAGISLIEDADPDFYHDWVAPKGYFTLRDRDVPKGVEEITKDERNQRERESVRVMQDYFEEPYDAPPVPHPKVEGKPGFDS